MSWQLLLVVLVTGAIIGLCIAAWVSMVNGNYRRLTQQGKEQPPAAPAPDPDPLARPARPRLRMRERQAELHRGLRERTGHVDTVMIKLPLKDGDDQDSSPR